MWLKLFNNWNYNRRYKAALVVLIGAFAIQKFDTDIRDRIELEMNEELSKSLDGLAAWKRWGNWYAFGAFRASAMHRLGIEPPVSGLSWSKLFRPWRYSLMVPRLSVSDFSDFLPAILLTDFRMLGQPTEDAKRFLLQNNIEIPDEMPQDPYETDDLAEIPDWMKDINKLKKVLKMRKAEHK